MKKQTLNIFFAFFTLYFGLGAFFPFNSLYLQDTLGYTGSQIGLFYSLAALIVVISVPFFGIIADKIRNPNFVYICCALMCVVLLIPFSLLKPFFIITTLYILINGIRSALIPMLDTISLDYCAKTKVNFGIMRSAGSLAFIISSIITGYLLEGFSEFSALFIYIHLVFIAISAYFIKKQDNVYQVSSTTNTSFKADLFSLIKDKKYLLIIFIMGLSYGIIQVSQAYISLSILDLGGSADIVGISFFFLVVPEVIFFGLVIKFTKRIPHMYLMFIGAIYLLLRWLVLLYSASIMVLLLSATAHGVVMAFITIVGFDLLKRTVKANVISSAMSIYTGLANIFFAIISFIAGYALERGGVNSTYLLYLITTIIVIVAIIVYVICYMRGNQDE